MKEAESGVFYSVRHISIQPPFAGGSSPYFRATPTIWRPLRWQRPLADDKDMHQISKRGRRDRVFSSEPFKVFPNWQDMKDLFTCSVPHNNAQRCLDQSQDHVLSCTTQGPAERQKWCGIYTCLLKALEL